MNSSGDDSADAVEPISVPVGDWSLLEVDINRIFEHLFDKII